MAVTYYDKNGRRVPAPRHDVVPSNGSTAALVVVALVLIIGFGVWAWLGQREVVEASKEPERVIMHDSLTAVHTYDGETIRVYVATDPDTNRQYLVTDRGGICVREDRDESY